MKRLYAATLFCCLACLLAGANQSFGQNVSRKAQAKSPCAAGDVAFKCPKSFKALPSDSEPSVTLMYRKDYHLGLFVAVPEAGFDEQKFLSGVLKTALAKFFPKESEAFLWKPLNSSGSVSKYEVGGLLAKGFNGNLSVSMRYRRLKVGEKNIFVGYVAKDDEGKRAKEFFEGAGFSDSMSGCNAAVEVIYSITGEKLNEDEPPCVIVLPMG